MFSRDAVVHAPTPPPSWTDPCNDVMEAGIWRILPKGLSAESENCTRVVGRLRNANVHQGDCRSPYRFKPSALSLLQIKDPVPFQTHTSHVRQLPSPNQPGATRRFGSPVRSAGDLLGEGSSAPFYFARDLRCL